jgi:PIN domain nuclease of toxin-antitoxin system
VSDYVADTHALFWYLTAQPRLGEHARAAFIAAEQGQAILYIPSIVVAELYYVNVKLGQPLNFPHEFQRLATAGQFRFVDFTATDVLQFDALSAIQEMHDRIVVGVARALGLPLLTSDRAILTSGVVQTIW